jgi:hypothetical protein
VDASWCPTASRKHLFADEAGDFNFSPKKEASRYFIICTVCMDGCDIGHKLLELRRELAWSKAPLGDYFHASEDKQAVRDRVFELIARDKFAVDATIMEKCKAQPQTRTSDARFYQYGWYFHLKHVAPRVMCGANELMITAASLGTKREQAHFTSTVNDVAQQIGTAFAWATSFCASAADPCLQIADYCTWAIQRKWEKADTRSYDLIKDKILREYDLWQWGTTKYY